MDLSQPSQLLCYDPAAAISMMVMSVAIAAGLFVGAAGYLLRNRFVDSGPSGMVPA